jgi:hypothetical protein
MPIGFVMYPLNPAARARPVTAHRSRGERHDYFAPDNPVTSWPRWISSAANNFMLSTLSSTIRIFGTVCVSGGKNYAS